MIYELADSLGAIAALGVGLLLGRRMRPRPPEPLRPICTCGDGYGTHEVGGRCQGQVKQESSWDSGGFAQRWVWVPCPCLHYDGPDPVIFGLGSNP